MSSSLDTKLNPVEVSPIKHTLEEQFKLGKRPLQVDPALLESVYRHFIFCHKAIWAKRAEGPKESCRAALCLGMRADLPSNWAFVARGSFEDLVVYFICEFGKGAYIPTVEERAKEETEERADSTFSAILQRENKKHAALCISGTKDHADVWYMNENQSKSGELEYDRGGDVLKGGVLTNEEEWVQMARPLSLGALNELMSRTSCAGKKYNAVQNNCQDFARSLFQLA